MNELDLPFEGAEGSIFGLIIGQLLSRGATAEHIQLAVGVWLDQLTRVNLDAIADKVLGTLEFLEDAVEAAAAPPTRTTLGLGLVPLPEDP